MARYSPWRAAKSLDDVTQDENISKPLMKSKSEGHLGSGRSFTSDTLRTYLTNDSRKQFIQSQYSSSQGCFLNQSAAQAINDSSSLVDLTKQASSDSCNGYETQETTIDVIPTPHCSRHMPSSKSEQFRNSRTLSLPQTHEFDESEMHQNIYNVKNQRELHMYRSNSLSKGRRNQKMVRQISIRGPTTSETDEKSGFQIDENSEEEVGSPERMISAIEDLDITSIPTPILVSEPSPSSSTTSSYSSRTLPRRLFNDLPRLPEHNSFSSDNEKGPPETMIVEESTHFTDVEPPDLFNNQLVTTYNTLPHGGKRVTVFSKRGNVRAATLSKGTTHQLTHV